GPVWKKIRSRTLIICLLGYLMYWLPCFSIDTQGHRPLKPLADRRIMCVLQRIAPTDRSAAVLLYYWSEKTALSMSAGILTGYWGILYLVGQPGAELTMAGNAVTRLDLSVLGTGHIYRKDSIPFDPEGILSTLPAIVNVIGGYIAGIFIQKK